MHIDTGVIATWLGGWGGGGGHIDTGVIAFLNEPDHIVVKLLLR